MEPKFGQFDQIGTHGGVSSTTVGLNLDTQLKELDKGHAGEATWQHGSQRSFGQTGTGNRGRHVAINLQVEATGHEVIRSDPGEGLAVRGEGV